MEIANTTKKLIELALAEDIGYDDHGNDNGGDITSNAVIPADAVAKFEFSAREEMVVCGLEIANYILSEGDTCKVRGALKSTLQFEAFCKDGDKVSAGTKIATVSGNALEILALERMTLNFMQHLSAIATLTNKYVQEVEGTKAKILDTRKTTPGWRDLEKYAVRCGGGQNHRMRLNDMVLIKDNHITAAGGIEAAVAAARAHTKLKIELEVDTIEQLHQAIAAQPDIIMLDNFSLENLREAVKIVAGGIPLEASGGVNLQTVKAIAQTGVDRISTSKITQSAPAVDIGLDETE